MKKMDLKQKYCFDTINDRILYMITKEAYTLFQRKGERYEQKEKEREALDG